MFKDTKRVIRSHNKTTERQNNDKKKRAKM